MMQHVQDAVAEEWLREYGEEQAGFKSFVLLSEVKLREVLRTTRGSGLPSALRTAVCCELLDDLSGVFGRYRDLLRVLSRELQRSIYAGPEVASSTTTTTASISSPRDSSGLGSKHAARKPYFQVVRELHDYIAELKAEIRELREVNAKHENARNKQRAVFISASRQWQRPMLRSVFTAWKHTVRSRQRRLMRIMFSNKQRVYFLSWKDFVEKRKQLRLA